MFRPESKVGMTRTSLLKSYGYLCNLRNPRMLLPAMTNEKFEMRNGKSIA